MGTEKKEPERRNSIGDARAISYGTMWQRFKQAYPIIPEHELRATHLRWKKLAARS